MGLLHQRNLLDDDCEKYCHSDDICKSSSDKECIEACLLKRCDIVPQDHNTNNISSYLIVSFSIAAVVFLLLCCYAIYVKFYRNNNNRLTRTRDSLTTHSNNFIDHEQGPEEVDHPVWYIRTPGLQQSIIDSITVCKYNKDDGLIEGTDCSVCLSEFQQDDNLRLLPKCNHAFHLPCIDTWLTSHTNCPMCRAPIVTQPIRVRVPSINPIPSTRFGSNSTAFQSSQMDLLESLEDGVVNGEQERGEIEEDEGDSSGLNMMHPRRSVSLDSSSAANINLALSTVVSPLESHHGNHVSKMPLGNLDTAPCSMRRARSFNGKHLLSWYSRSQKSNGPVRSF